MDNKKFGGFTLFIMTLVILAGYFNIPPAGPIIRSLFSRARFQARQAASSTAPNTAVANNSPTAAGCIANMRAIEAAKVKVRSSKATQGMLSWQEVLPFLAGPAPRCPGGGEYVLGNHQIKVRCSLTGSHVLK